MTSFITAVFTLAFAGALIHIGFWLLLAAANLLFYGFFDWSDRFFEIFYAPGGGIEFFSWKILAFALVVAFIRGLFSSTKTVKITKKVNFH